MRYLFLLCFAMVLLTGCCTHYPIINTPLTTTQQAQSDLNNSVALVGEDGPQNHHLFCSGTWVAPHVILTAAHCVRGYAHHLHQRAIVEALVNAGFDPDLAAIIADNDVGLGDIDATSTDLPPNMAQVLAIIATIPTPPTMGLDMPYIVPAEVTNVGQEPKRVQHSQTYYYNPKTDLALLRTQGFTPRHGVAVLAEQTPAVGSAVTYVGNIHGFYFSYRTASVSAYRATEKYDGMDQVDGPFLQLGGADAGGGDSGSGVFDDQGHLVGVVSFISTNTNFAYAIHAETIRALLIGQKLMTAHLDLNVADPPLVVEEH